MSVTSRSLSEYREGEAPAELLEEKTSLFIAAQQELRPPIRVANDETGQTPKPLP